MRFVKIGDAAKEIGVCTSTLRRWADQGKIQYKKSSGGHRFVDVDSYLESKSKIRSETEMRSKLPSSTVESFRQSKEMISKDKPTSLTRDIPTMKSSPISDQVLSPYWLESCVERSKTLLSFIGIDYVTLDSLSPRKAPSSWYSTTKTNISLQNKSSQKICWQSLLSSHVARWGKGDIPRATRKSTMERIYPSPEQKKKLRMWMDDARLVYNTAVGELSGTSEKRHKYSLSPELVTAKNTPCKDEKILRSMKRTPKDIRAKAVFEACVANDLSLRKTTTINPKYASLEKVLKTQTEEIGNVSPEERSIREAFIKSLQDDLDHTPKFIARTSSLKMRSKKAKFSHIFIPKTACKVKDKTLIIYPSYKLKPIILKKNIKKITADFQIRWNRRLDIWHIITSEAVNIKPESSSCRTIAFDPGIRTFLTGVGSDGTVREIAKDWAQNKKIRDRIRKLDITLVGKRGRDRYNSLKAKRNYHLHLQKLQNMINDLHKKASKEILDNYDVIILPKLRVKRLLKTKGVEGSLGSKTNRNINLLAHGKFHDYLSWKAMTLGKIVIDQNEAYTTQTCFKCGILNNIGSSKTYECKSCGHICDRDIQSSFNIMTRYMSSYSSTTSVGN